MIHLLFESILFARKPVECKELLLLKTLGQKLVKLFGMHVYTNTFVCYKTSSPFSKGSRPCLYSNVVFNFCSVLISTLFYLHYFAEILRAFSDSAVFAWFFKSSFASISSTKENCGPKVFMLLCTVIATFDSTKICCNLKAVQERSYKLPHFAMQAIFFSLGTEPKACQKVTCPNNILVFLNKN